MHVWSLDHVCMEWNTPLFVYFLIPLKVPSLSSCLLEDFKHINRRGEPTALWGFTEPDKQMLHNYFYVNLTGSNTALIRQVV